VFGALSAALIIMLTTLLVKRVSGNRTTEIVEMNRPSEDQNGAGDPDSVDELSSGRTDEDVISNTHEIVEIIYNPTYKDCQDAL
jgi:hypothetical protein